MAVVMNDNLLTYTEAASELGVSPSYIGTLVARGKIHAVKNLGDKRKYISRSSIDACKRGETAQIVPIEIQSNPLTRQTVSAREVLELINEGFSKISGDYKDTVSPVIQHVVSTDEEALLNQVTGMFKILMRNIAVMLKQLKETDLTADDFLAGLLSGIDLPSVVKDKIIGFIPELLRETESL
jgi:excisionase family DNA binding protein